MNITDDNSYVGFHDDHVYGFSISEGTDGHAELVVDIDHIVEWLDPVEGRYRFKVAPAFLTFYEVCDLVVNISYSFPNVEIGPFSIDGIRQIPCTFPDGSGGYEWRIEVNYPEGHMAFKGKHYTLGYRSEAVVSDSQRLPGEIRRHLLRPGDNTE